MPTEAEQRVGHQFWSRGRLDALRALAAEPIRIRISGDCMAPQLCHGARVWVRAQPRYWPGDVLVVRARPQGFVAHRLIGVYWRNGHWRLLTQGDNAAGPDHAVTDREIVGRVSGGECSHELVDLPLGHRLDAMWRFLRFAIRRSVRG